jgi:hypothetical protein
LAEQRTENPRVGGSIPPLAITRLTPAAYVVPIDAILESQNEKSELDRKYLDPRNFHQDLTTPFNANGCQSNSVEEVKELKASAFPPVLLSGQRL